MFCFQINFKLCFRGLKSHHPLLPLWTFLAFHNKPQKQRGTTTTTTREYRGVKMKLMRGQPSSNFHCALRLRGVVFFSPKKCRTLPFWEKLAKSQLIPILPSSLASPCWIVNKQSLLINFNENFFTHRTQIRHKNCSNTNSANLLSIYL